MKAITLTQPWAQLMADGRKHIETRSWAAPRHYLGDLLAIHAAKGWTRDDILQASIWKYDADALPRGAIVAAVRLLECRSTDRVGSFDLPEGHERLYGDYSPHRFAWYTAFVSKLDAPIKCAGHLGVWDVPDDIAEQIESQLS